MKPALTKSETRIIQCIAVDNLSVRETSDRLCVIYQCIANHLQSIYDKLGTKRNLQALTKWYYTVGNGSVFNLSETTRKIGAAILLCLFSVELFNVNLECRLLRQPRRKHGYNVEILIEN